VVEITPPQALAQEAARLTRAGELQQAAALYQRLLARWPDSADSWYNLALVHRRLREYEAALESYAQALQRGVRRPEEVHLNRSVIYADCLRRDADAERELNAALAINPDYVPALHNLANLHEDLGRREAAMSAYARILSLDPEAFDVLARYMRLAPPDDANLAALRSAMARCAGRPAQLAGLGFALAQMLEAREDYAGAFAAAASAKQASRASTGDRSTYDRGAYERFVDAIIAAFPAADAPSSAPAANTSPQPLFLCGIFRSGSTLAERVLSASGQLAAGGELDLLPHLIHSTLVPFPDAVAGASEAVLRELRASYLAGVTRLFPSARYVSDKWMENFIYVGLIRRLFPDARIVHTTRDPLDTCLSIYFLHLDPRLAWALDLQDIGHYFVQYRRLMAHWQALHGEHIFDLNYDEFVREPLSVGPRLFEFCGIPWQASCLELAPAGSVKTASVWQVREPLYTRSSGRARHYAAELEPLAEYLRAHI
jgi:sulfotransferase family protein/tetratricopeptide repeat protein